MEGIMEVFAVIWWMEYEGEVLMGIFSDYVKARKFMLEDGNDNLYIRKVVMNEIYMFGACGEEI
jgi:hypothetical protein